MSSHSFLGVRGLRALLVLALGVSVAGCSAGRTPEAYREAVLAIERSLQEELQDLRGTSGLKSAEDTLELVRQALEAARDLEPPPEYERGHGVLIEYYEASEDFSALDLERLRRKADGRDTASLEEDLAQKVDAVVRLWGEVRQALPFLQPKLKNPAAEAA